MSDAYQCDRCGEYDSGSPKYELKIFGRELHRDFPGKSQLCRDCSENFVQFMNND